MPENPTAPHDQTAKLEAAQADAERRLEAMTKAKRDGHQTAALKDVSTRYPVNAGDLAQIEAAFGYNPTPTPDQLERIAVVRGAYAALAVTLAGVAPRGRLYSVAMTDLEKSAAAMVKAIAHEPTGPSADLAREMAAGTAKFESPKPTP